MMTKHVFVVMCVGGLVLAGCTQKMSQSPGGGVQKPMNLQKEIDSLLSSSDLPVRSARDALGYRLHVGKEGTTLVRAIQTCQINNTTELGNDRKRDCSCKMIRKTIGENAVYHPVQAGYLKQIYDKHCGRGASGLTNRANADSIQDLVPQDPY